MQNNQQEAWVRPQDIPTYTLNLENIEQALGKYLTHEIKRQYKEDFMDADTGEVVTIDRYEFLMAKGAKITKERLAELQFIMPAYDIQEVTVTDKYANANDYISGLLHAWEVQLSTSKGRIKLLTRAQSIGKAITVAAEYVAMNFETGGFLSISKANCTGYSVIEDTDPIIPQTEEEQKQKNYYRVTIIVITYIPEREKYEHEPYEIIVKANDVGQAKDRVGLWANKAFEKTLEQHPCNHLKISKASPYDTTAIIPREYCKLYYEKL